MYVWFFDAKHNLPGNSDPIKQVVDEANIVDEGVYVSGAQHQQSWYTLSNKPVFDLNISTYQHIEYNLQKERFLDYLKE